MQRHLKGIQWFAIIVVTLLIISFVQGWYFLVYAIAALAALIAFVYLIGVTRFDNHPSDEDEAERERAEKRALHGPRAPKHR